MLHSYMFQGAILREYCYISCDTDFVDPAQERYQYSLRTAPWNR